MPQVKELVKVTEVKQVTFQGTLNLSDNHEHIDNWGVTTADKKFDSFEEWFEKLAGKHVRVTIEVLYEQDDSDLLEAAEEV